MAQSTSSYLQLSSLFFNGEPIRRLWLTYILVLSIHTADLLLTKNSVNTVLVNRNSRSFLVLFRTTFYKNQGLEYLKRTIRIEQDPVSQSFEVHGQAKITATNPAAFEIAFAVFLLSPIYSPEN